MQFNSIRQVTNDPVTYFFQTHNESRCKIYQKHNVELLYVLLILGILESNDILDDTYIYRLVIISLPDFENSFFPLLNDSFFGLFDAILVSVAIFGRRNFRKVEIRIAAEKVNLKIDLFLSKDNLNKEAIFRRNYVSEFKLNFNLNSFKYF